MPTAGGIAHLHTSHRNKNNGITFDNSEQGTYTRQANTLSLTAPPAAARASRTFSAGAPCRPTKKRGRLLYGDERPDSNQIRAYVPALAGRG